MEGCGTVSGQRLGFCGCYLSHNLCTYSRRWLFSSTKDFWEVSSRWFTRGMAAVAMMKGAVVCLALVVLCFGLTQYNNTCFLWRGGPSWRNAPGLLNDPASEKQEQMLSTELSFLLKEAMLLGQADKATIHLVQLMEEVKRPFFMFVCSNCNCDICEKVRASGYWSPVETMIFHYILRRSRGCNSGKALVVDVGSHVGYFSLISASYGCRVASFEPNSEAIRFLNLSRAINNYDRITFHQKGVGQAGTRAMYRHRDTWALDGFVENRRKLTETTDVVMLDSVIDGRVLIMKVDTEGYEANVFTGARDLIYQHQIRHLLVEVKQASSLAKGGLLWAIGKMGGYTHVYNWNELSEPLTVPFHQFRLPDATIIDVSDIVHDQASSGPLLYQDFWFCRQCLPWL